MRHAAAVAWSLGAIAIAPWPWTCRLSTTVVSSPRTRRWQAARSGLCSAAAAACSVLVLDSGWPRPTAYTREFPKLTCVGSGPRPHRVCRQWGFRTQALVFL
eukprot:COSAG03_NODE_5_length_26473_cov_42.749526_5_plen_102_part_00